MKNKHETGYKPHSYYFCIDEYKITNSDWIDCPNCGLRPKSWEFDNERKTSCGCWASSYNHFTIQAESILSVHKRTNGKKMNFYVVNGLKNNWNHWVKTGEILYTNK